MGVGLDLQPQLDLAPTVIIGTCSASTRRAWPRRTRSALPASQAPPRGSPVPAPAAPRLVPKRSSARFETSGSQFASRTFPRSLQQAAHSHRPTSSGNLTKPFSCNSIKCQLASGAAALTDLRNERSPFRRRMLAQGAFRDPIRCARLQKSRLHRHGSRRSAGPKGWKRNGQR